MTSVGRPLLLLAWASADLLLTVMSSSIKGWYVMARSYSRQQQVQWRSSTLCSNPATNKLKMVQCTARLRWCSIQLAWVHLEHAVIHRVSMHTF